MTSAIATPTMCFSQVFNGAIALIDDRDCEPTLGGNKARKLLGGILDDARARGARVLITCGAHGSHHVLATAVLGARGAVTGLLADPHFSSYLVAGTAGSPAPKYAA